MSKYEDIFVLKDKVSNSLIKINKNLENFNNKLRGTEVQLANFQKKTESMRKMGKGLQDFGNKMTVGVTLPIIGAMSYASKMGMEFQDAEMRLQTMLGSAEKGTEMFNKIVEMGAKTPFEARDLLNATNTMLGFGVAQERVLPLMMQLGDISAGNRERFQQLALAFSQVSAAGKLQGQDLLQMINAGFNPLEQIARRTGKSVGYWKDEMSKGKVTVAMVEQAMKDATSAGGRFNGMMDKMSQTASGKLSTMLDNFNTAMAQLGQVLLPYVTKGVEFLTAAFEKFTKLSPGTQKMILLFGALAAAIGPMITGLGSLFIAITALNTAFTFLAANPVVLAVIAITAAIAGLIAITVALWQNWTKISFKTKMLIAAFFPIIGIIELLIASIKLLQSNWGTIWATIKNVFSSISDFLVKKIKTLITFVNNLLDRLGVLAYLIPGLNTVKIGKDIAQGISQRYTNNNIRNTSHRSTITNNTTHNNFYGDIRQSSTKINSIISAGQNVPSFAN